MRATDMRSTAYGSSDVDDAIAAGAASVDSLCHRGARDRGIPGFAPWTGTLTFDWPNEQRAGQRLWLDQFSLYSLTAMTSGGVNVLGGVLTEDFAAGPPYSRVDINRGGTSAFSAGNAGGQRSLVLTGVWCGVSVRETIRTTASSIDSSSTALTVAGRIDVGEILRIDSERMFVTEKGWASSGQTASLAASNSATTIPVADGSVFRVREELLIDGERLMVVDVAANTLVVKRAFSGSVLAAHTGATIYWPRALTVERGALGTTAAAHSGGANVLVYYVPPLLAQLNAAYALDNIYQDGSGYARTVGSGEGERNASMAGLRALEERVRGGYGRKIRHRAV